METWQKIDMVIDKVMEKLSGIEKPDNADMIENAIKQIERENKQ